MRISAEENHTRHNMIFEKMLVGYATLYEPDALREIDGLAGLVRFR